MEKIALKDEQYGEDINVVVFKNKSIRMQMIDGVNDPDFYLSPAEAIKLANFILENVK